MITAHDVLKIVAMELAAEGFSEGSIHGPLMTAIDRICNVVDARESEELAIRQDYRRRSLGRSLAGIIGPISVRRYQDAMEV